MFSLHHPLIVQPQAELDSVISRFYIHFSFRQGRRRGISCSVLPKQSAEEALPNANPCTRIIMHMMQRTRLCFHNASSCWSGEHTRFVRKYGSKEIANRSGWIFTTHHISTFSYYSSLLDRPHQPFGATPLLNFVITGRFGGGASSPSLEASDSIESTSS